MKTKELTEEINIKLREENNIKVLKTYFNDKRNKSFEDKKDAGVAISDIIFYTDDIGDVYFNWGVRKGPYAKDIFCSFERKSDEKKVKNMLMNYGFTIQQTKKGLWIRGVKEQK